MKITIQIDGCKPENKKAVMNSIKGFVKSLAKRFCFNAEFSES